MRQITLFDEEEMTGLEDGAPDMVREAWKKAKSDMRKNFASLQALPYGEKLERQEMKAREFLAEMENRGSRCHVSVGGLDSITLWKGTQLYWCGVGGHSGRTDGAALDLKTGRSAGMKYGKMLKEERERQGISRKELAEKAGVTDRAVTYWESGKRHMNLESADRVFKALNMSITIGA